MMMASSVTAKSFRDEKKVLKMAVVTSLLNMAMAFSNAASCSSV